MGRVLSDLGEALSEGRWFKAHVLAEAAIATGLGILLLVGPKAVWAGLVLLAIGGLAGLWGVLMVRSALRRIDRRRRE